jgi:anti-anti-sigma factor
MNAQAQGMKGFAVGQTTLAGATVLSPSASLTFENCGELRLALAAACEGPAPRVVLDFAAVAFMDSAALELLVEFHERLHANQRALRLINLNDVCTDILAVTRLVHTVVVCEGISQAVKNG